ncbi:MULTISPECIES: hypothetical protein [unclassified Pseudomonas]|jgi:hypothetical protein|uniref:hypothetical protein n=1 Tax=unclassified Pseudomonas TaxID=196821 RepID=UPI000C2FE755|nr:MULTISPECIES: hypothetical protein [unclassified Pseudomonas]MCU1741155.1 hypothetical protein [Pseudomonas sp. 20S_6.2_Bac1]
MNHLSEKAKERTQLFESLVLRQGAALIPGRYGGDYNNDQLAIFESDSNVTLLLGLKFLDAQGGLQLDTASLGPHTQYSKPWLNTLVMSLNCLQETAQLARKIDNAIDKGTLVACVVCLDVETQEVKMLRIAV